MLFARARPPLPLLWRVFLINAAMLTIATLALALSPATVSFPLAVTEGVVLIGGLAATLALDLVVLRRALSSVPAPVAQELRRPPAPRALGRQRAEATRDVHDARLLLCWNRPYHLADADAAAWTEAELTRVLAATRTDRARLTRLRGASPRFHPPCDWLLEVDLEPHLAARECVVSPAWGELLADLQLLGMRPSAMVAGDEQVLGAERD